MSRLQAVITNPVVNPKVGDVMAIPSGGVLQQYLTNFVRIGFIAGSVALMFMLLWGAFEYITSGGEKEKTGAASKRMTNAVIGIVILLSLYAILKLVNLIFGINLLNLEIPIIG